MIILILVVLGLCLGSFINALVWRLRQQSLPRSRVKASPKELSVVHGRSMCPNCRHKLSYADLLPVFSWLMLKGRCRYCKTPISWQYPVVEVLTAVLMVISYVWWPYDFDGEGIFRLVTWLIVLVPLVAMFIYDLRWMILPDKLTYLVLAIATLQTAVLATVFDGGGEVVLQAVLGLLSLGGLFYLLFQISGGKWIGGGDVKLGFGLGLLLGSPVYGLAVLFTASFLGTVVALPLMALKKVEMQSRLAFGPFLLTAAFIVQLSLPVLQDFVDKYLLVTL